MNTVPSIVLWDDESWHAINLRQLRRARGVGALVRLPIDLTSRAILVAWRGDLAAAASALAEADAVTDATHGRLPPFSSMLLAALRGDEAEGRALIAATLAEATAAGQGLGVQFAHWTGAILFNGLARYDLALEAARTATDGELDLFVAPWAMPELIEASVRNREPEVGRAYLERLEASTSSAGGDWALGIEARCRALLAAGPYADACYREAITRLRRTRLRTEIARAHLLYGEWLRHEGRRADARMQLRTAHDMLATIGMQAFRERARRELVATGEKVRKRTAATRDDLTAQEAQIAWLARDGLSNSEIGAQLFISARTVEWHLGKVFAKLGITSRSGIRTALPEREPVALA